MATTLQVIASATNDDARYAEVGVTAIAEGGALKVIAEGYAFVVATWIGGETFVVASQDVNAAWSVVETTRERVAYVVSTSVESVVFDK